VFFFEGPMTHNRARASAAIAGPSRAQVNEASDTDEEEEEDDDDEEDTDAADDKEGKASFKLRVF
jgi:hypothetical protein